MGRKGFKLSRVIGLEVVARIGRWRRNPSKGLSFQPLRKYCRVHEGLRELVSAVAIFYIAVNVHPVSNQSIRVCFTLVKLTCETKCFINQDGINPSNFAGVVENVVLNKFRTALVFENI